MKPKFTLKKVIVLMSIVFVYSCALTYISVLAKTAVLEDIAFDGTSAFALSTGVSDSEEDEPEAVESSISRYAANYLEITNKADIYAYEIFAPAVTEVSAVTSGTKASAATTTPAETSAATVATTAAETTVTTVTTTTAEAQEDEEIDIDEDSEIDLDKDNESMEDVDDSKDSDSTDSDSNLLYSTDTASSYHSDNLSNGKSYKTETLTVYDSVSGRYVTDNAFDIVCKVTYYEMGTAMNDETIKAQAVAAYTYIKHYEAKGEYASVGLKSDVPDSIVSCVEAVDGLAMYYDGEYILATFCAATGGVTCSSKNVWGGERAYLKSVVSAYDFLDTDNYGRITTYTAEELKKKIESKTNITLSNDYENWIKILNYTDGGYVGNISIDGHTTAVVSGSERTLTAYIFRTYILSIRSTCFTVSYSNGVFTFVTYGYGHGVGMSQEGANLYAEYAGYTFDMILHHYYTDITIG